MATAEERFWEKVDRRGDDECWPWLASTNLGYGVLYPFIAAHRFSYELLVGPIPEGLEIDHLCRNRKCVNPAHLEAVTHRENCRRGVGWAGQKAKQTHCKRGHPFDGWNTYWHRGKRHCRACMAAANKRYRERRRKD